MADVTTSSNQLPSDSQTTTAGDFQYILQRIDALAVQLSEERTWRLETDKVVSQVALAFTASNLSNTQQPVSGSPIESCAGTVIDEDGIHEVDDEHETATRARYWRYDPEDGIDINPRIVPDIKGERYRDRRIAAGTVFEALQEVRGEDGVLYLELAEGGGWLFDKKPGVGIMCVPHEGDKAVEAREAVEARRPTTKRFGTDIEQLSHDVMQLKSAIRDGVERTNSLLQRCEELAAGQALTTRAVRDAREEYQLTAQAVRDAREEYQQYQQDSYATQALTQETVQLVREHVKWTEQMIEGVRDKCQQDVSNVTESMNKFGREVSQAMDQIDSIRSTKATDSQGNAALGEELKRHVEKFEKLEADVLAQSQQIADLRSMHAQEAARIKKHDQLILQRNEGMQKSDLKSIIQMQEDKIAESIGSLRRSVSSSAVTTPASVSRQVETESTPTKDTIESATPPNLRLSSLHGEPAQERNLSETQSLFIKGFQQGYAKRRSSLDAVQPGSAIIQSGSASIQSGSASIQPGSARVAYPVATSSPTMNAPEARERSASVQLKTGCPPIQIATLNPDVPGVQQNPAYIGVPGSSTPVLVRSFSLPPTMTPKSRAAVGANNYYADTPAVLDCSGYGAILRPPPTAR